MADRIRELLTKAAHAAIRAANPMVVVPPHLPPLPESGKIFVLGAGKASAAMARAVEHHYRSLGGDDALARLSGLVVTRYGHSCPTEKVEIAEASHPVPDEAGLQATRRIMDLANSAGPEDLVLFLVSGGGSALLTAPTPGLTLEDKQSVNAALLASGADIVSMNTVRKHMSAVKGGRLAHAVAPARLLTLAISDVPGDDLATIASGPTVPDPTTLADARAVFEAYSISLPKFVAKTFNDPANETPKAGDPIFQNNEIRLVAAPQASLEAAAAILKDGGYTPLILGDSLEGESREVGQVMAGIARQVATHGQPAPAPVALISGGETTVTLKWNGKGGPNGEFLLSCALALNGGERFNGIAIDTDGIDGTMDNAGAIFGPDTLATMRSKGRDPETDLLHNDSYSAFQAADSLIVTGPTQTNVNDFRAILISR